MLTELLEMVRTEEKTQISAQLTTFLRAWTATEIQNVQIGWGDVCRQMAIPIYMIFPRLFTCPTMLTPGTNESYRSFSRLMQSVLMVVSGLTLQAFKVEFETNVVVLFENGHMITENFPIILYR